MDIIRKISEELKIRPAQTQAAVQLIDEGNTIPFISRYRKEATGSLNDEQLRALDERLRYLRNLEEKKAQVKVLTTHDVWHGVTYAEDKRDVMEAMQELKEQGVYPEEF